MEIAEQTMKKLFSLIETSEASIFDCYCAFDVNRKGYLEKFDFITGLQSLGIAVEPSTII